MNQPALGPVVVIGTGLLGASVGAALTEFGERVQLRDRIVSHARVAATLGAGSLVPIPEGEVKLVVVAVPPTALASVVAEALLEYPSAVVTDVGSVKGTVLRQLAEHFGDVSLTRYVGCHPMAGSHLSGPVTARPDLFVDRTWAITPHREATPEALDTVHRLGEACGGRVIFLDPDDHDAAVARISHLPHLMSVLMADHLLDVPREHLWLAGQGVRDVTRIAGSDPVLWEQIITTNARALRPELEGVRERLNEVIEALDNPPSDRVRSVLEGARAGTRRIPGKHGAPLVDYAQVVVEIPDSPGALAKLFTDISQAGVNIEDVSIEHDPVRRVGSLSVAVDPERRGELERLMREAGWFVG
ncbi:prephenate dehydrogenase [Enemella sp. A6]|uniref:prephenate dehydrogenase n=1 Tax=Enemella sp. A6 TaxID=3440152 RepID=UPI003EBB3A5E